MKRLQSDNQSGHPISNPQLFSKEISINSFNLDGKVSFGKNGMIFEGKYKEISFKLELALNGTGFVSYHRQLDRYPVTAATFQRTKEILSNTSLDPQEIKNVLIEIWSNIEKKLHEVSMSNTKVSYNQIGEVEAYLNRMISFHLNLSSAKIEVLDPQPHGLFSSISNALRKV